MDTRRAPLRPASSLVILLFDWLVFAHSLTHDSQWILSAVVGGLTGGACVGMVELRSGSRTAAAWGYAGLAAAVIACPLPLLGTVVAVVCLIWSAVVHPRPSHR